MRRLTAGLSIGTGTILAALSDGQVGGNAYDKELPTRHLAQLY